jgi:hypothetical protein
VSLRIPRTQVYSEAARRPTARLFLAAFLLGLAGWAAGCEGGEGDAPPAFSAAEIERYEALGYTDWAEEPADDGATGVVVWDRERASPGYNLVTYPHLHRAELFDMEGRVLRVWTGEGKGRWHRAILAANGDLIAAGQQGRGEERRHLLARLAVDGSPSWRRYLPVHHHLTERPDGNIAVLTRRQRWLPGIHAEVQLADNGIALVSPDGELIEERSIHDMLYARPDVFAFLSQASESAPSDPDFLHANFVDWMDREDLADRDPIYALTNVLVTVRDQNTLAIFDWDHSEVVWAWGQGELLRPHGAGVIGNGNIIVFDNRPGEETSRVVELDPLAREIVWEYGEGFYSETRGAAQRLPNGNTFIGESNEGRAIEVTRDGEVVWEWRTPHRNQEAQPAVLWIERYPPASLEGLLP